MSTSIWLLANPVIFLMGMLVGWWFGTYKGYRRGRFDAESYFGGKEGFYGAVELRNVTRMIAQKEAEEKMREP